MAAVTVTLEGWGVDVWDAGAWGQTSAGQQGTASVGTATVTGAANVSVTGLGATGSVGTVSSYRGIPCQCQCYRGSGNRTGRKFRRKYSGNRSSPGMGNRRLGG